MLVTNCSHSVDAQESYTAYEVVKSVQAGIADRQRFIFINTRITSTKV
ncbi:hypothetical protein MLPF_3007 [Mycobacterium lepromatosis]|nr:hypothetical protein MLPF_3007 [Mycobacterium lepromatosis]